MCATFRRRRNGRRGLPGFKRTHDFAIAPTHEGCPHEIQRVSLREYNRFFAFRRAIHLVAQLGKGQSLPCCGIEHGNFAGVLAGDPLPTFVKHCQLGYGKLA